jgi:hypothetical protein
MNLTYNGKKQKNKIQLISLINKLILITLNNKCKIYYIYKLI